MNKRCDQGILLHIRNDNRLRLIPCRATYTFAFADGVAGKRSLERPKLQLAVSHDVETNPEEIRQRVMEQSSNVGQCTDMIINAIYQRSDLWD